MTRRGLIGALLVAATMDPERLLWVPGQRVISIPKPVVHTGLILSGNRFLTIEEFQAMYLKTWDEVIEKMQVTAWIES
jgi:hypothetical protein